MGTNVRVEIIIVKNRRARQGERCEIERERERVCYRLIVALTMFFTRGIFAQLVRRDKRAS